MGRSRFPLAVALLAATAASAAPRAAAADGCPLPDGADPGLADVPDAARLEFLRTALADEAGPVRTWTGLWGAGYLMLATTQVAAAPALPAANRPGLWLGAGGAGLGLAVLTILPLGVQEHGPILDAYARALGPEASPCALIARGERWLELDAGDEEFGTSWLVHVGSVVVNAALALTIGFAFHDWLSAGIAAGVGLAVGETMVLTQPTALIDAWERYRTAGGAEAWPSR
ncbi:MAG: hypothetical protein HY905_13560 [Deltaproteobacteria bacterium]|nr:hypothetical protein [Deltaproteobacteria bacterium]